MTDSRPHFGFSDPVAMPKTPTSPSFSQQDTGLPHEHDSPSSAVSSRLTTAGASDDLGGQTPINKSRPPVSIARHGNGHNDVRNNRPSSNTPTHSRAPWSTNSPRPHDGSMRNTQPTDQNGAIPSRPASRTATHVPSLAQTAFYRPMSSQRLQAQRGMRSPDRGGYNGGIMSRSRNSMRVDEHLPSSRGTDNTELTDDGKPVGGIPSHGRFVSLTDSVRPLQRSGQQTNSRGLTLNLEPGSARQDVLGSLPPAKSPRSPKSFSSRLSFTLPTRNNASNGGNREMQGREKLSSRSSSVPSNNFVQQPIQETPEAPFSTAKSGRNHQYFGGNTRFWAGGRLQNARDRPVNIITGLLVILPGILFFIFSASWLWHNVSPAIPLVFAYIYYICVSSFIHASVSDPGILPRNIQRMPPPEEDEDPLRLAPSTTDWVVVKSTASENAAMEMPVKYCKTCNIWRPPRGHHCRICDNCIDTHDHHCVWLNNCVGRRNYRYFFTFVASGTLMGGYLLAASLTQILLYMYRENTSFGTAINVFRVPFAMVIYAFLASPYPIALTAYHVFLMARGETTREYLNSHKFIRAERYRAFTQTSMIANWIVVLCRPRPPTYIDFKKKFEVGDQRFGEKRVKKTRKAKAEERSGVEMQKMSPGLQQQKGFQGPTMMK